MAVTTTLSVQQREAIVAMARSVDLVWGDDPLTLPANHSANMMQIESTLLSFGDAVSMVHQLPLSAVGLSGVDHPGPHRDVADDEVGESTEAAPVGSDATAVLDALRVAEGDRDPDGRLEGAYEHMSRAELMSVVEQGLAMVVGRQGPLVINQGRPILENLYMAGTHRQGFRDWSEITVADRHMDLAVACVDIIAQCGPVGLAVFLDGYGMDRVDPVRLDWYSHVVALSRP